MKKHTNINSRIWNNIYSYIFIFLFFLPASKFESAAQQISFSSLNGPYGGNLGDVVFTSDGEIFVSAYYSSGRGIYKSTDNGLSWQLLPPIYSYNEFLALGINQNDFLFAGTSGAGLYRSTDKGETWTWLISYNSQECWAIAFNDSGHIFAGDGDWGGLYKSTDDGNTWTQLLPNSVAILAIEVDREGTIYVGTWDDFLKSTDNGITWNSFFAGLPYTEMGAVLTNEQNEIFVGTGYFSQGDGIYYSHDGGESWIQSGLPGKTVYSLTIGQFGSLYAGTQDDGVYRSTDNGISWEMINKGLHNENIFRVKMSPANLLFACSESDGGIYRSTNFGDKWEITGVTAGSVSNGFIETTGNIFTATRGGIQKYEPSTEKWSILFSKGMTDIIFKHQSLLFACTSSSVYISTDFGITWEMTNPPGSPTLFLLDLALYSDNSLLVGTNGYIRRSTDNGDSWTTIENGLPSYWIDNVAVNDEGNIFTAPLDYLCRAETLDSHFVIIKDSVSIPSRNGIAVGSNGLIIFTSGIGIFRSTDYGDSWVKLSNQNARSIQLFEDNYIVAGLRSGQGIMLSSDKGDTWITVNEGLPSDADIKWNYIDSEGYLYTAVDGLGLYKSNSIVTGISEHQPVVIDDYILEQNYPNPFNATTTIAYSINTPGLVSLKVFDDLGNEVASLVNLSQTAGYHEVNFNAGNLSSGIYFYTLTSGNFMATKKLVLLK